MRGFCKLGADLKRMLLSSRFYLTVLAVFALCILSVCGELKTAGSVYSLVSLRHGIGAFLMAMSVLAALPGSLFYREDLENNYIHGLRSRVGHGGYCWPLVLTAAVGAFFAVLLGYLLFYGVLRLGYPMIAEADLAEMAYMNDATPYETWFFSGRGFLYFLGVFVTEAAAYSFMAVFALMMSVWVGNLFVLLSLPVLLYYGSISLCGDLNLPSAFRWYNVLKNGGFLRAANPAPALMLAGVLAYFSGLILIEGMIFSCAVRRRYRHG